MATSDDRQADDSTLPEHRVSGIGGFFFRSRDPEAMQRWYEQRLGVLAVPHELRRGGLDPGGGGDRVRARSSSTRR